MAEECRKKKIRNDCGSTSVGDGVVRFTYGVGQGVACGEDIGSISMDQCENETINIPCPTSSVLEIQHCDETHIYDPADVEDTVIDLGCGKLVDWSRMPVCDDCIVWCGDTGPLAQYKGKTRKPTFQELAADITPQEARAKLAPKGFKENPPKEEPPAPPPPPEPAAEKREPSKWYLLKFWSTSCGICGRMAHYDQKVGEEEGCEFVSVKKANEDVWNRLRYVAEKFYPNPEKDMGFPNYFVAFGPDLDNLTVTGQIMGGMDKGKFRAKIKEIIEANAEAFEQANKVETEWVSPYGNGSCTPKVKIDFRECQGEKACYNVRSDFEESSISNEGFRFKVSIDGDNVDPDDIDYGGGEKHDKAWGDWFKHGEDFTICVPKKAKKLKIRGIPCEADTTNNDGISCRDNTKAPGPRNGSSGDQGLNLLKFKDGKCNKVVTSDIREIGNECYDPGDRWEADYVFDLSGKNNLSQNILDDGETCEWRILNCGEKEVDVQSCITDPCDGVSCGPCEECNNGECVSQCKSNEKCENGKCVPKDPCEGVSCGPCEECNNGECVDQCKDDEKCEGGKCVPKDPCKGVSCGPCQECVNGECVDQCKDDEKCEGGKCVPKDPCAGVSCPPCHKCVNGECVNQCGPDQECDGGNCVGKDPCEDVSCGPCQECIGGECIDQCGSNQECVDGECVDKDPCEGVSCPPCHKCVNGECVNQCSPSEICDGGSCVPGDPCEGVTCPPCHECVGGECVSLCKPGEICDGGTCVPGDPCEGVTCPPCHTCVNGECVNQCSEGEVCDGSGNCVPGDPCFGVTCPPCHTCVNGECVSQCTDTQECIDGTCQEKDPCAGVECPPCNECVNGECESLCADDEECVDGNCEATDPCSGVSCPPCSICVGGECVDNCPPDYECIDGICVRPDPPIVPEEPFECDPDCTGWTIDWSCIRRKALEKMGKIVGKDRITVWPSHGDLRLGDVEISSTGNTGPGVDIIYDPIFIDFEEQSDGSDYWADRNKEFDYFGSRGIQDDESWIPYMVKDVEKSKLFTLQEIPAEANGAFVEINFRGAHSPSVTHALNHPSYLLDETVETFLEFKNLLAVTGGEFVSGQKDSMHNNLGFHMACKLDPTSVISDIQTASNRQQKLNFMTFTPGTRITMQTKVYVIHYHYTSAAMGLGRAKITPVRYVESDAGLRLIRQQIDNFNIETANSEKYYEKPADVVRMQGADLRQAVDQLNSAIDFKLAVGGGNASQIQQLRSDLNSQVLQGSGNFQTIRTRLTALKTTAESLGVIGLTKLEKDAGVQWGQPGDPNHSV